MSIQHDPLWGSSHSFEVLVSFYRTGGYARSILELLSMNVTSTVHVICRRIVNAYCLIDDSVDAYDHAVMLASVSLEIYTAHIMRLCRQSFDRVHKKDRQSQLLVEMSGHSQCALLLTCISYAYKFLYGDDAKMDGLEKILLMIWDTLSDGLGLHIECTWGDRLPTYVAMLEMHLCCFHDWCLGRPMLRIFGYYGEQRCNDSHLNARVRLLVCKDEICKLWTQWKPCAPYTTSSLPQPVSSLIALLRSTKKPSTRVLHL